MAGKFLIHRRQSLVVNREFAGNRESIIDIKLALDSRPPIPDPLTIDDSRLTIN